MEPDTYTSSFSSQIWSRTPYTSSFSKSIRININIYDTVSLKSCANVLRHGCWLGLDWLHMVAYPGEIEIPGAIDSPGWTTWGDWLPGVCDPREICLLGVSDPGRFRKIQITPQIIYQNRKFFNPLVSSTGGTTVRFMKKLEVENLVGLIL